LEAWLWLWVNGRRRAAVQRSSALPAKARVRAGVRSAASALKPWIQPAPQRPQQAAWEGGAASQGPFGASAEWSGHSPAGGQARRTPLRTDRRARGGALRGVLAAAAAGGAAPALRRCQLAAWVEQVTARASLALTPQLCAARRARQRASMARHVRGRAPRLARRVAASCSAESAHAAIASGTSRRAFAHLVEPGPGGGGRRALRSGGRKRQEGQACVQ
jgi:hypothetical protein